MKKLFMVISILLLTGCSSIGIFSKNPKEFVAANELGKEYEIDEKSASDKYDDKYIQVTGIIKLVFEGKDEVEIQLFGGVSCSFTKDLESVLDLKMYNMVVLNGTVDGLGDSAYVNTVIIKKCELVEQITTPEIVTTSSQISSLNLAEIGYEVIEISGVIYSLDLNFRLGINLIEDEDNHFKIEFEEGFDLTGIEAGDTVTITGVVMPFNNDISAEWSNVYGYKVSNIIKAE